MSVGPSALVPSTGEKSCAIIGLEGDGLQLGSSSKIRPEIALDRNQIQELDSSKSSLVDVCTDLLVLFHDNNQIGRSVQLACPLRPVSVELDVGLSSQTRASKHPICTYISIAIFRENSRPGDDIEERHAVSRLVVSLAPVYQVGRLTEVPRLTLPPLPLNQFTDDDPFFSEVSNFVDCIEGGPDPHILSSFEDATKTYE